MQDSRNLHPPNPRHSHHTTLPTTTPTHHADHPNRFGQTKTGPKPCTETSWHMFFHSHTTLWQSRSSSQQSPLRPCPFTPDNSVPRHQWPCSTSYVMQNPVAAPYGPHPPFQPSSTQMPFTPSMVKTKDVQSKLRTTSNTPTKTYPMVGAL